MNSKRVVGVADDFYILQGNLLRFRIPIISGQAPETRITGENNGD
jgi:hypothetical protein